jgi:hypothetical protein
MGLFSKEVRTVQVVELSDEVRQQLTSLDNDIQILQELQGQVIVAAKLILQALGNEAMEIAGADEVADVKQGITDTAKEPIITNVKPSSRRESPYTRRPYSEQYSWLKEILSDRDWHHPSEIADEYATDPRHHRYLKSAVNRVLGDMIKEGNVEREAATVRGNMYRYRWVANG